MAIRVDPLGLDIVELQQQLAGLGADDLFFDPFRAGRTTSAPTVAPQPVAQSAPSANPLPGLLPGIANAGDGDNGNGPEPDTIFGMPRKKVFGMPVQASAKNEPKPAERKELFPNADIILPAVLGTLALGASVRQGSAAPLLSAGGGYLAGRQQRQQRERKEAEQRRKEALENLPEVSISPEGMSVEGLRLGGTGAGALDSTLGDAFLSPENLATIQNLQSRFPTPSKRRVHVDELGQAWWIDDATGEATKIEGPAGEPPRLPTITTPGGGRGVVEYDEEGNPVGIKTLPGGEPPPDVGPGGEKAPAGFRWTPDGSLEPIPGGPKDPAQVTPQRPTEKQGSAQILTPVAESALAEMEALVDKFGGVAPAESLLGRALPGKFLQPADVQRFRQAGDQLAQAILRVETGAQANADEIRKAVDRFVPQVGDKPEAVAQKLAQARRAVKQIRNVAEGVKIGRAHV